MSEQSARIMRQAGEIESAGFEILDDTRAFIARFCAFPDKHCLTAITLWAAHTHIVEHLHTTPRLALLSPEAGSGKTRVLEVLDLLVPEPLFTLNASPAAVFRTLANGRITLLFDEVDAIWSKGGKDDNHEDLRALLNSGYKVGATIPRCVGPKHDVIRFEVFCPVALAGLGDLPDTIMSRSVIIRMRRRAPNEKVDPFRSREHDHLGHAIRDRLAGWGASVGKSAGEAWPTLPDGIVDRPAEVWEPLLAVAEAAGGDWPVTAREACLSLCAVAEDRRASLGVRLLADIRTIFEKAGNPEGLHTATILQRLVEGSSLEDDAPWSDLRGKPIAVRGLATMLRKYGIRPKKVREPHGESLQGYERAALWDAWQRYLPPVSAEAEHPEQTEHASNGAGSSVPDSAKPNGTSGTSPEHENRTTARYSPHVPDVPDMRIAGRALRPPEDAEVY